MANGKVMYLSEVSTDGNLHLFEDEPDVMSVDKVADLLDVAPMTIRREITRGNLECSHVGSCIRITKAQLLQYLDQRGM